MTKITSQFDKKNEQIQLVNSAVLIESPASEEAGLFDEFSQILDKIAEHLASGRQDFDTIDLLAVEQLAERIKSPGKPQGEVRSDEEVLVEPEISSESDRQPGEEDYVPAEVLAAQTKLESADGVQNEPVAGAELSLADGGTAEPRMVEKAAGEGVVAPIDGVTTDSSAPVLEGKEELVAIAPETVGVHSELRTPMTRVVSKNVASAEGGNSLNAPVVEAPHGEITATPTAEIARGVAQSEASKAPVAGERESAPGVPFSAFLLQGGITPNGVVSREAVAQSILRPGMDSIVRSVSSDRNTGSKTGPGQSGLNSNSDASAMRGLSSAVKSDSGARQTKALSRVVALKTLEKVERALEEVARSKDGKTISLNLEPVNLGKVKVDVSIRDGNLHARLSAESSDVRQLLREHAHELQALLRKLGLHVDTVAVSVSSEEMRFNPDSNSFEQRQSSPNGQQERTFMPGNSPSGGEGMPAVTPLSVSDDHWVA
jgi:hypothetical protein